MKEGNLSGNLWPAVVLVLGVLAGVVALAALRVDLTALTALVPMLVLPLLGVLLGKVSSVEQHTNGNTSALLDLLDRQRADKARMAELLAQAGPIPPDGGNVAQGPAQGVDGGSPDE